MKMKTFGRLAVLAGLAWQGVEARAQSDDEKVSERPGHLRYRFEAPRDGGFPFRGQGQDFSEFKLEEGAAPNRFFVTAWQDASDDALGLTLTPVPDRLRSQIKLPEGQGVIASAVDPEGPAARVGLRINDILLSLGDAHLAKADDLAAHLEKADESKPLELKILRGGKPVTLNVRRVVKVTLGPVEEEKETTEYVLGVAVSVPDDALRAHLEIPEDRGLLVDQVVKGSAAEKGGIKQNDVLLSVAGKPLDGTEALVNEVREAKDKPTELRLLREGTALTLVVTPEKRTVKTTKSVGRTPLRLWMFDPSNPNSPRPNGMNFRPGQLPDGPPGLAFPRGGPGAPDARIEKLEAELKSLREAIDGLKNALKSDKDRD